MPWTLDPAPRTLDPLDALPARRDKENCDTGTPVGHVDTRVLHVYVHPRVQR